MTEDLRKTIFFDLVRAQDAGSDVPASRLIVATKHGISADDLALVTREGLDRKWPPLDGLGAVGQAST